MDVLEYIRDNPQDAYDAIQALLKHYCTDCPTKKYCEDCQYYAVCDLDAK